MQRHYNKYGEEDLVFIVIEFCLLEFLIVREQHYIDLYKPYFNISKIAGNSLGVKHSEEFKEKCRNRRHSEETKIKMRKPKSEEHKQHLRKPHGPMSNELKEKHRLISILNWSKIKNNNIIHE